MTLETIKNLIKALFPPERRILNIQVIVPLEEEKELSKDLKDYAIQSGLIVSAAPGISMNNCTIRDEDYTIQISFSSQFSFSITKLS